MIASKISISHETRAKLNNQALSPVKKRELRENMVKERIRSAVGGECTKQELVAAAGYDPDAKSNDYANGVTLINSMLKRGLIAHNGTSKFRKAWTVIEQAPKRVPNVTPTPAQVAAELMVELKDYKHLSSISLLDMAKTFAWTHNSDSLREFIDYIENAIK